MQESSLVERFAELLAGKVADRHDEVGPLGERVDRSCAGSSHVEPGASRGFDSPWTDLVGGPRSCARGGNIVSRVPHRRGELRPGRVRTANEEHMARHEYCDWLCEHREDVGHEPNVLASSIARRCYAFDESGIFQHAEMVSEEVRPHSQEGAQLRRRSFGKRQLVDDPKAVRVGERRVDRCAPSQ